MKTKRQKSNYTLTAESSQYAIFAELPDSTPPQTNNSYDGEWHITDFAITLSATDDQNSVNQSARAYHPG